VYGKFCFYLEIILRFVFLDKLRTESAMKRILVIPWITVVPAWMLKWEARRLFVVLFVKKDFMENSQLVPVWNSSAKSRKVY
jgi:hypothetical protein